MQVIHLFVCLLVGGDRRGRGDVIISWTWDGNTVTVPHCLWPMYLFSINQLLFEVITYKLLLIITVCVILGVFHGSKEKKGNRYEGKKKCYKKVKVNEP